MARYNDMSCHPQRWTNAKLMREARKCANLERFSCVHNDIEANYRVGWHNQVNKDQMPVEDFVREQTRPYRQSWLDPILDEIERRFVKVAAQ